MTYTGTMASLAGDALAGFAAGDGIDVTDLYGGAASLHFAASGDGGVLTVLGGLGSLGLSVSGLRAGSGFSIASDQHGGSLIRVT